MFVLKAAQYAKTNRDVLDTLQMEEIRVLDTGDEAQVTLIAKKKSPLIKRVMKKLFLESSRHDKGTSTRSWVFFRREAAFLQSLKHQNIVRLSVAYQTPSYLALVMEALPTDLYNVLPRLSYTDGESIIRQLVNVVRFLHEQRIVHGDLKLENILLNMDGIVKLCDFGHAQVIPEGSDKPPRWNGTDEYLAPEFFDNSFEQNAFKMDNYALGIVIWALLFGIPPDNDINYLSEVVRCTKLKYVHEKCLNSLLEEHPTYRATISDVYDIIQNELEETPERDSDIRHQAPHPIEFLQRRVSESSSSSSSDNSSVCEDSVDINASV